jgi:hypothetical protein
MDEGGNEETTEEGAKAGDTFKDDFGSAVVDGDEDDDLF